MVKKKYQGTPGQHDGHIIENKWERILRKMKEINKFPIFFIKDWIVNWDVDIEDCTMERTLAYPFNNPLQGKKSYGYTVIP